MFQTWASRQRSWLSSCCTFKTNQTLIFIKSLYQLPGWDLQNRKQQALCYATSVSSDVDLGLSSSLILHHLQVPATRQQGLLSDGLEQLYYSPRGPDDSPASGCHLQVCLAMPRALKLADIHTSLFLQQSCNLTILADRAIKAWSRNVWVSLTTFVQ